MLAAYLSTSSPVQEEPSVASLASSHTASLASRDPGLAVTSEADALLVEGILEAEAEGMDCLVQLLRGQKKLLDGNYEGAAEYFETCLSGYLEGDCEFDISIYVYTLLLDAYHGMGHHGRCISVAKEWIERFPASVTSHSALAQVLYEQGQYDDCIEACTAAVAAVDECEGIMPIYAIRGKARRKKGLYEQSVKDFQQVKALSQKEGLVRFTEDKPPFLTTNPPIRTSHLTPHAERKNINAALVALVKKSKSGVPSPDCSPDKVKSRHRGRERHFERSGSSQRLLTASPGHVF